MSEERGRIAAGATRLLSAPSARILVRAVDRAPLRTDEDRLSLKPLALLTALGVGLRLLLLVLSGEPELQSDEANYVYLALMWNRFDVYFDQHRFLWPPAYTWYLGAAFDAFGDRGLFAARVGQTLASASIGLSTMLFAYRLFGMRAARVAGLIWIVYLPLAVFSHLLWNETLFLAVFLPALYQVLRVTGDAPRVRVDLRLLVAGFLFAASLLVKEAPTYLVPVLALTLACSAGGIGEGLRRASLLLLAIAVVLVPWGLRNQEVYGRFVFAGASLGENVYNGLNAAYRNFDLIPLDTERLRRGEEPITDEVREWFVAVDEEGQWDRAEEIPHVIERSDEHVARGLAFARERPGWLFRSRVKKLADLVTPMSFYTRHLALGHYDPSVLGGSVVRKLTGTWALFASAAVLLLGLRGLVLHLPRGRGGVVVLLTIGYVAGTSLLVAMSRFRTPIDPLLIALAAGALVGRGATPGPARRALAAASVVVLIFLWWVNFPEVSTAVTEMVWRRES